MKFLLNRCGDQQVLWDPSDLGYKNKNKSRNAFLHVAKRLSGAAEWTRFVQIENRSDRKQLCTVGLCQIGEAILRMTLTRDEQ